MKTGSYACHTASLSDAPLVGSRLPVGAKRKTPNTFFIMGTALASVQVNMVMGIM